MNIFKELSSYFEPTNVELKAGSIIINPHTGQESKVLTIGQNKLLLETPGGKVVRYIDNLECLIREGRLIMK